MNRETIASDINTISKKLTSTISLKNDIFELIINNFNTIYFKSSSGGANGMKGNSAWLTEEHKNGSVHEPGLMSFLILLHKNDIKINKFLDIGSHYGYWCMLAANIFHNILVRGVEINPDSKQISISNVKLNSFHENIIIDNCAINNETYKTLNIVNAYDLHKFTLSLWFKFLLRNIALMFKNKNHRRILPYLQKINNYSLSDYCASKNFIPDLIKIDVEGFQSNIIPKSFKFLKKYKPILMIEFDDKDTMKKFNTSNKILSKIIIDCGYSLIWGDHRNSDVDFKYINLCDIDDSTLETNSLGIFIPNKYFY